MNNKKINIKCRKCKSNNFNIIEIWDKWITWSVEDGILNYDDGYLNDGGNPIGLSCACIECGNNWRLRKKIQIADLFDNEN